MKAKIVRLAVFSLLLACVVPLHAQRPDTARFRLHRGDRIALLGNTFVERMVAFGYFETLLLARFPQHFLTLRNLGWSGDTLTTQLRPLNFGDYHTHLQNQKADVVFLFFGMNESFDGDAGLPKFRDNLQAMIDALRSHRYNGRRPPRLVIVSPIPHEPLPGLPPPTEHNKNLANYTEAMREVSAANQTVFLDLYKPLLPLMGTPEHEPLTLNGIHLTRYGYWVTSQVMMDGLGLSSQARRVDVDVKETSYRANGVAVTDLEGTATGVKFTVEDVRLPVPPPPGVKAAPDLLSRQPKIKVSGLRPGRYALQVDGKEVTRVNHTAWNEGVTVIRGSAHDNVEELRTVIVDKNQQFFYRWHAVNGEYIYGRRAKPFGVISFPPEMAKLDQMVGDREKIAWDLAAPPRGQTMELIRVEDQ